jgi:hypothetical protein
VCLMCTFVILLKNQFKVETVPLTQAAGRVGYAEGDDEREDDRGVHAGGTPNHLQRRSHAVLPSLPRPARR